jgi:hypothetical protein
VIIDFLATPSTPCLTAQSCAPSPQRNLIIGQQHIVTECGLRTVLTTEETTYIGQHRKDNIHWTTQKRPHTLGNTEKTTYIGQHRKDNIHWTTQKRQHTLDNTEKTTYIGGTLPDGYVTFCSSINFFATTIGFLIPEIYNYKSFL